MAEERDDTERSEDPTQKRLDDALERGDVAKSQEVNTWFVLAGATLVLMTFSGSMGSEPARPRSRGLLANMHTRFRVRRSAASCDVAERIGVEVLAAIAIPLLLLALAAIAGNMIQHRLVWSAECLKPKLCKISPAAGLKRLFSKQALVNFVKGLVKLALIGTRDGDAAVAGARPARHAGHDRRRGILPLTARCRSKLLGVVVAILAFIAAADFLFQYRQWYERQKMSLREIKEEFKQTEGDPMIKAQHPPDPRRPACASA